RFSRDWSSDVCSFRSMTSYLRNTGDSWLVISDVSKQPTWSILMSINTELGFIRETVSSLMIHGLRPWTARMAPMTTSQPITALRSTIGWITDVNTRLPTLFCSRRNRYIELSNTFTCAPNAMAVRAANSPTVPAPRMTISVGGTPVTPPNINPFPSNTLLRYSAAINTDVAPTISLIARTTVRVLPSSRKYS